MDNIKDNQEFEKAIEQEDAVFAYFSHEKCSVCKTLKPKLSKALQEEFPLIKQVYIDIEKLPEVAGQQRVFTVPVIVVYFEGQESIRKARNVGVQELLSEINRPYKLLFED